MLNKLYRAGFEDLHLYEDLQVDLKVSKEPGMNLKISSGARVGSYSLHLELNKKLLRLGNSGRLWVDLNKNLNYSKGHYMDLKVSRRAYPQ